MPLGTDFAAFFDEHMRCGDLDNLSPEDGNPQTGEFMQVERPQEFVDGGGREQRGPVSGARSAAMRDLWPRPGAQRLSASDRNPQIDLNDLWYGPGGCSTPFGIG